ncbi:MAG: hypothetical protein CVU63_08200 [Deltaproteobacteria bacterium HGW-Deltaproteobacteria-20]|jgi:hypothetical protein|nr:MAG: hypothetical protein CVU63_08200 [Deltaproteobacteria bacterium HGW-Deltaproteobacteria-20]
MMSDKLAQRAIGFERLDETSGKREADDLPLGLGTISGSHPFDRNPFKVRWPFPEAHLVENDEAASVGSPRLPANHEPGVTPGSFP